MANHKSALKRTRQNVNRRIRNKSAKTRIKNVVKEVRLAVSENSSETAGKLDSAKSTIAKAAKKGVIHKRAASRRISRLARLANRISA